LKISFNCKFGAIRVYKAVVTALDNPKYVFFTWAEANKCLSVYGTDEANIDCLLVSRHHDGNEKGGLKLYGTAFIQRIGAYVGWSRNNTYTVDGSLNEGMRRVDFNLDTAVESHQA
jgi:hypothetical protein